MKTQTMVAGLLSAILGIGEAEASSTKVAATPQGITLDTKLSGDLGRKFGLFVRDKTSTDYAGKVSHFGLVDLTYPLKKGFGLVGEMQFSSEAIPHLGVDYFISGSNWSAYILVTASPHGLEVMGIGDYDNKLSDKVELHTQLETIHDVGLDGYQWGAETAELGLGIGKFDLGLQTIISHPETSVTPGVFVKKSF